MRQWQISRWIRDRDAWAKDYEPFMPEAGVLNRVYDALEAEGNCSHSFKRSEQNEADEKESRERLDGYKGIKIRATDSNA